MFRFNLMLTFAILMAAFTSPFAKAELLQEGVDAKRPLPVKANPTVAVDKYGNLLLEGQVRYLVGTEVATGVIQDLKPLPGGDPQYDWLYNGPINFSYAKRLGFDSLAFFAPHGWVRNYDPKSGFFLTNPDVQEQQLVEIFKNTKIPLYIDFTCAPWLGGSLVGNKGIDPAARNTAGTMSQGNHWVPYNIISPQGRALYREMWQYGTQKVVDSGATPLVYELFNEPAYSEISPLNRQAFLRSIKSKYKNITELNRTWASDYASFKEVSQFKSPTDCSGLFVQWSKFLEHAFTELCREGVTTIRKTDTRPNIQIAVQPGGAAYFRVVSYTHINYYEISRITNAIITPTTGGITQASHCSQSAEQAIDSPAIPLGMAEGFLMRHFMNALAGTDKPIYNGEAYGRGRKGIRNMYWLDLMRGGNGAYLFLWTKRAWDPLWSKPDGAKKLAMRFFFMMLNTESYPTQDLNGPLDFKRELEPVNDLFVPRQNRPLPPVSLLFSYPTERYSLATGSMSHHLIRQYAGSLTFSHMPYDLLLEEQLDAPMPAHRRVIIAAGIENTYAKTIPKLMQFVRQGGALILGKEKLPLDQWGKPIVTPELQGLQLKKATDQHIGNLKLSMAQAPLLPGQIKAKLVYFVTADDTWQVLATLHNQPAVLVRTLGQGHIYYIAVHMPDYALASLLDSLLQREQVMPSCQLANVNNQQLASNVEIQVRQNAGVTGYFLYNYDAYPKLITLTSKALKQRGVAAVDTVAQTRYNIENGSVQLLLEPEERQILVVGPSDLLPLREVSMPTVTAKQLKDRLKKIEQSLKLEKAKEPFLFPVNASKAEPLDLSLFANRNFVDRITGDGKGGWTDQGENSLRGIPLGRQSFLGVPFDIIRYDENFEKTCIILKSKNMDHVPLQVLGIPVNKAAKAIYFLTATAWSKKGTQAMLYIIHYEDGSQENVPIVCGEQTGDWWIVATHSEKLVAKLAWANLEHKGFYAYRWENPHLDRRIRTLDIVSSNNAPIPITIAITVEKP